LVDEGLANAFKDSMHGHADRRHHSKEEEIPFAYPVRKKLADEHHR